MSVTMKIENCGSCPHLGVEQYFTADSFEHNHNWYCKKSDRPKPETTDKMEIVQQSSRLAIVENKSDEPKNIPSWCPLRV